MRKIKHLLFIISLVIFMMPVVYAKEGVEIKSIELVAKSGNAVIKSEPTFNGLEMNYGVSFKSLSDYVKYKAIISNNTDIDYKISDNTSFNESEYINYNYEVTGELKANSEIEVFITITYKKKVDSSKLISNKYTETSKAFVQLMNEDNTLLNPSTRYNIVLILVLIVILCFFVFILWQREKKLGKYSLLGLLIGISVLPFAVLAVELLKLTINVIVEIDEYNKVGYLMTDDLLLTDEELADYKKTSDTVCDIVYIGTKDESNRYNSCSFIIYEDEARYLEGDEVQLKAIEIRYYANDLSRICALQDDNSYLCPTSETVYNNTVNLWYYDNLWKSDGYIYELNDQQVMNFNEIPFDLWDSNGFFYVYLPQSFTMPGHNVLFALYRKLRPELDYCSYNPC